MKALILAGGKATRLLPITAEVPKCLLPIGAKTILGWQIEALLEEGAHEVVLITGMHADQIEAYMKDTHPEITATFLYHARFAETRPAAALYIAKEMLSNGDVLYLNGDALFEKKVLGAVLHSEYKNATAIRKGPWDEEQVNVILDGNRIIEIGKHIEEKPSYGEFMGITKIDAVFGAALAKTLEETPQEKRDTMYAVDAIQATIVKGYAMHAIDVTAFKALEIDTAEDYSHAQTVWAA